MKNRTYTITDEQGNSIKVEEVLLRQMMSRQILMYNKMIEKKHFNPHLTQEELYVDVKNLLSKREKVENLQTIFSK